MRPRPPGAGLIREAERFLARHAPPSPLVPIPAGVDGRRVRVWLKLETFSPTGSFKWRGALFRLSRLSRSARGRGVVTASTGNHGAAVAWAARRLGVSATVVVPQGTAPYRRRRIASLGARVLVRGKDWNASLERARLLARDRSLTLIEDGEDPVLMAGTATVGTEILRQLPGARAIVAPVGGGNLVAGLGCAIQASRSRARLFGVQSASAPGAFESWRSGRISPRPVRTLAAGIATAGPVPLAFGLMKKHVSGMVLVSDRELVLAVGRLALDFGVVAEPAAAAPFAAMPKLRKALGRGPAVLVVTGRSLDAPGLRAGVRAASRA